MFKTIAFITAVLIALPAHAQAPVPAPAPAQAAPQAPKNLKVLQGMTRDELMRTMNLMRASLGVRCEFCHVETADGLDFPNDAKEEKQQAREMIELVKRINATTFSGRPVVSCYTCHRGSDHPVNILPLPAAPPPPAAKEKTEAPVAAAPTLDAIIAKYVKASAPGPVNRTLRGTMTDLRGPATIELVQSDGRTLVTTSAHQRGSTQMYAGEIGWIRDARGTREMTAADLRRFRDSHAGVVLPQLDTKAAGWRPPAMDEVGDRKAWRVERRSSDGRSERYWFDTESGVLLRMLLVEGGPIGRVPQQVDFADYRDVDGVRVPFTIRNSMVDVRATNEKKFDSMETAPVDGKRFSKD